MIISFGNKETEQIWNGFLSRKYPEEIQNISRRKLRMLNNSHNLNDLRIPPSNRLEKLKGNLHNYYSIRINDKWRIIFVWEDSNSYDVQIIDYH
jgi:toxin HigB-1